MATENQRLNFADVGVAAVVVVVVVVLLVVVVVDLLV
jgi:hypothetical protein